MKETCIIILNYRRAELTIECLRSVVSEVSGDPRRCAVVIDNCSGDGSADEIDEAINRNGWGEWASLVRSPVNGGFAAGNNIGFEAVEAEKYLLLNSDARLTKGAVDKLLAAAADNPEAGMIGPRLQGPEGEAQASCFRYRTPMSEFLAAAGTGALDRLFSNYVVAAAIPDEATEAEWVSFACILIRREVVEGIGLMDDGYFMYFADIDYARRAGRAGWRMMYEPTATAVHLRGGTSSVKRALTERARVPRYYYEARSRYFAKYYGGAGGVAMANGMWLLGRAAAGIRELLGNKRAHACAHAVRDNWTNWLQPMRAPTLPGGGEL